MKQTAAKAILTVVGSYMYFRNARIIFQFRRKMGYWPDVSTPARYNEKLLWRKLFDHNPRFTRLSNRAAAQEDLVEKAGHRMSFAPRIWMGDDIQTSGLSDQGDMLTDFTKSDDAQGFALQLDTDEGFFVPSATGEFLMRLRNVARNGKQHAQGVLSGGQDVAKGGVHHDDAMLGGSSEVDVVDANPSAADDFEARSASSDDLRRDDRG